jgi:hypothetical protein
VEHRQNPLLVLLGEFRDRSLNRLLIATGKRVGNVRIGTLKSIRELRQQVARATKKNGANTNQLR